MVFIDKSLLNNIGNTSLPSHKGKQVISSSLFPFTLFLSGIRDSRDNNDFFLDRAASTATECSRGMRAVTDVPATNALVLYIYFRAYMH